MQINASFDNYRGNANVISGENSSEAETKIGSEMTMKRAGCRRVLVSSLAAFAFIIILFGDLLSFDRDGNILQIMAQILSFSQWNNEHNN